MAIITTTAAALNDDNSNHINNIYDKDSGDIDNVDDEIADLERRLAEAKARRSRSLQQQRPLTAPIRESSSPLSCLLIAWLVNSQAKVRRRWRRVR